MTETLARADDAPQIAALFQLAYQESSHPCKAVDFVTETFASATDQWFVAAAGNRIVACTASVRHDWNGAYECCRSVTAPEFRGAGLGARLYVKCLEETCARRDCDLTISHPRTWAMFRLMSKNIQPATVLLGHDGAMNIANGRREFHLIGMTSNGHGPLRRVIPGGSKLATNRFVTNEILAHLEVESELGEYPPDILTGPASRQEWTTGAFTFRIKHDSSCPSGALEVLGVSQKLAGPVSAKSLAVAFRELFRSFSAAQHVSLSVLVDKEDVIFELAELGFHMTAYLPAWHRDAVTGQRYDAVHLVRRSAGESPTMHGTEEAISRFDEAYHQIIHALANRPEVEAIPAHSFIPTGV